MQTLKYPIKYAVMEMEEQIGWYPGLNELEREYGVVANIVSKCYVIRSQTEYLNDGRSKTKYDVVFPYSNGKDHLVIPEYSFYETCINATTVDQLFDSFESAKAVADNKNNELINKKIGCLSFYKDLKKKLDALRTEHQEKLNRYQKIEDAVEQETSDMKISKAITPLEELVIKLDENNLYDKIASVLSPQEKEYIKNLIAAKTTHSSTNEKPPVKSKK